MTNRTRNQKTDTHTIWRGLAIYKTDASPYWYARFYDRKAKRYVVQSTKETLKRDAILAAETMVKRDTLLAPVIEHVITTPAEMLFAHYAALTVTATKVRGKKFAAQDEQKLLDRKVDGLLAYFGERDIRQITSADVNQYFVELDETRVKETGKPMSSSTKAKHRILLNKIFKTALDNKAITALPNVDSIKVDQETGASFTDAEYTKLKKGIISCANNGDTVKSQSVTTELLNIVEFIKFTFVRPSQTELYGIKIGHVTIRDDVDALEIRIDGKTKKRVTISMPGAVAVFKRQLALTEHTKASDYLFFPEITNRAEAVRVGQRLINHVLEKHDLKEDTDGVGRTLYSMRHYSLQSRLRESGGQVNIYNLAKNAGTSVEMLEKFYIKKAAMADAEIENLHTVKKSKKAEAASGWRSGDGKLTI